MRRIITISIISALSCTLLACTDTDENSVPNDNNGDNSGNNLQTCSEDDFNASPLAGAGYNPKTGLVEPVQERYLAHTTFIVLKPDRMQRFDELMGPIVAQLGAQEGLVAYSLGLSPKCSTGRTVGIWKDEQAMADFVVSDAHVAAMTASTEVLINGAFAHWEVTPDQLPLSWDMMREKIAQAPAVY